MSTTLTTPPHTPTINSAGRTIARWLLSFAGFPLGGLAAIVLTGPVDSTASALAGGVVTGSVLGLVQAWAMRADRRLLVSWVIATAVGLGMGLTLGANLIGFGTDLGDVMIQGCLCGAAVGTAQAITLWPRTGPIALAWPVYLAGAWALGWAVTTSIGVQVADQFTVFGASGAITVTLLTAVLPLVLRARRITTRTSAS